MSCAEQCLPGVEVSWRCLLDKDLGTYYLGCDEQPISTIGMQIFSD